MKIKRTSSSTAAGCHQCEVCPPRPAAGAETPTFPHLQKSDVYNSGPDQHRAQLSNCHSRQHIQCCSSKLTVWSHFHQIEELSKNTDIKKILLQWNKQKQAGVKRKVCPFEWGRRSIVATVSGKMLILTRWWFSAAKLKSRWFSPRKHAAQH